MARVSNKNLFMQHHTGKAGNVVFKYRNKIQYFSAVPDMSKVIPSDDQVNNRSNFANAVEFAQWFMANPQAKLPFEVKENQSLFNAAVSYYRKNNKTKPSDSISQLRYTARLLEALDLNKRQIKAVMFLQKRNKLSNAVYQELNDVSKATATRDLQELVNKKIISSSGVKGPGAVYHLDFSNFKSL